MADFDYKQRPFASSLTPEEYDRAVGRIPVTEMTEAVKAIGIADITSREALVIHHKGPACITCGVNSEHYHLIPLSPVN